MATPAPLVDTITHGGQVPLLKQRIMQWFQEHQLADGDIARGVDSTDLSEATKASVTNVNRALWDLQKRGLITFREDKRPGNGHSSGVNLSRFTLTPKGRAWNADTNVLAEVAQGPKTRDDLNPDWMAQVDAKDIASEIAREGAVKRVDKAIDMVLRESVPPAPCTCGHPVGTRLRQAEHLRGCPWAAQQEAMVARLAEEAEALARGDTPEQVAERIIATERATHGAWVLPTDVTPSVALVRFLRWHEATTGKTHVKIVPTANEALGYHRLSTALYSIAKALGDKVEIVKGKGIGLTPLAEDDWEPETLDKRGRTVPPVMGRNRRVTPGEPYKGASPRRNELASLVSGDDKQEAQMTEAVASVALDTPSVSGTETRKPEPPRHRYVGAITPRDWPLISALMDRDRKRQKVAEAVVALEAAGLEDDALVVLQRIPDDTPFEQEVLRLVAALRVEDA